MSRRLSWQAELLLPGLVILFFLLVLFIIGYGAATGGTLFKHTFPPVPTTP